MAWDKRKAALYWRRPFFAIPITSGNGCRVRAHRWQQRSILPNHATPHFRSLRAGFWIRSRSSAILPLCRGSLVVGRLFSSPPPVSVVECRERFSHRCKGEVCNCDVDGLETGCQFLLIETIGGLMSPTQSLPDVSWRTGSLKFNAEETGCGTPYGWKRG